MASTARNPATMKALAEAASSTLSLVRGFAALLSAPQEGRPAPNLPADAPDPLDVLHTAATLLKAHVTKLSLLMINEPFTPSEIRKIISDVASTCIPAIMSAVEICQPHKFGKFLHEEVKLRVRKVFSELESMMLEVLSKVSQKNGDDSRNAEAVRDSLVSAGVVWEACDALMALKDMGVAGVALLKAQEYRAILEDAIAELKEWGEGNEDDEEEDEEDDFDETSNGSDELFDFNSSLPRDRPDLKQSLDACVKRLKLTSTLYQALIKRRLKTTEKDAGVHLKEDVITRLAQIVDILKRIPDQTDELASAFYDLDDVEVGRLMEFICKNGKKAAELANKDWKDQDDEFTAWAVKWVAAIDNV